MAGGVRNDLILQYDIYCSLLLILMLRPLHGEQPADTNDTDK